MACGGCGAKRVQAVQPQLATPQMAVMGAPQQQAVSGDIAWVQLKDGNIGDHAIVGIVTKQKYGHRKHGDKFKMLRVDALAMPNHFALIPDPSAQSAPVETPRVETPDPVLIVA